MKRLLAVLMVMFVVFSSASSVNIIRADETETKDEEVAVEVNENLYSDDENREDEEPSEENSLIESEDDSTIFFEPSDEELDTATGSNPVYWYLSDNSTTLHLTNTEPSESVMGQVFNAYTSANLPAWYSYSTSISSVKIDNLIEPESTAYWFYGMNNVVSVTNADSISLSNLDTSNVTNMSYMFYGCSLLASLNVSNFDTSSVTNMSYMFYGCSSLTSLDVSDFNTSNVTNMSYMFYGCSSLMSLDVSGFNTSNVTNMSCMFYGCSLLTALNVSGFATSSVTNMRWMFGFCSSLTSLNVSGFATSNVTSMRWMFSGCSSLSSLDVSGFDTSNVTDMAYMFNGCSSLSSLDVSGFDTSNVTDMNRMFYDCSSLSSLNVSGFNTSKVTNMSYMFSGCSSLSSLDVSNFDTSGISSMSFMFSGCSSLTSLDVSNFDTSGISSMSYMFSGCSSLTSLDVSNFNTSNVTYMSYMFRNCTSLEKIIVTNSFVTSNVESSTGMFSSCSKLKGGLETLYDGTAADKTYARIDGGSANPGYFTGKFKLSFDAVGGEVSADDYYVVQGETYGELPTPVKENLHFAGWYSDSSYQNKVESSTVVTLTSDTTLYAYWVYRINYVMTIEGADNSGNPTEFTASDATITLKSPVRTGYKFLGWYSDSQFKNKITKIASGTTHDVTVYAKWQIISYDITYSLNSGSFKKNSVYSKKFNAEAVLDLPDGNDITRTGYTFDGWYKEKTLVNRITNENLIDEFGYKKVTLYAKWIPITYYIQYAGTDGNGNPVTSEVIQLSYNQSYKLSDTILNNPGRKADKYTYTVNGKSTTVSSTSTIKNLVKVNTEEPIVLHVAVDSKKHTELWTAIKYTISYNLDRGTNHKSNKKEYTIDTNTFTLYAPSKKGAAFIGWYDNPEYSGDAITSIEKGTYGNRTFYAKWQLDEYTITLNTNGGTLPEEYENSIITYTVDDAFRLPSPKKEYCTFAGWYNGKTKVTSVKLDTASNMNLTAKWTSGVAYTIRYDANNPSATGKTSPTSVSAGKGAELSACGFKLTRMAFDSWNTMPDGSGIRYEAGTKISKNSPLTLYGGETVTLYAQYRPYIYSVKFDANNSKGKMNSLTCTSGIASSLPLNTLARTGYTFAGWNTKADGKGVSYSDGSSLTRTASKDKETFTLYAMWQPINYTICLHAGYGGSYQTTEINAVYDKTIALPANTLARIGYTFAGWSNEEDGAVLYTDKAKVKNLSAVEGNVDLYTVWKANSYTIVYNANGGKGTMKNQTARYDTDINLRLCTFRKTNYRFVGWSTSRNGAVVYSNNEEVSNLVTSGTVTLYAVWERAS